MKAAIYLRVSHEERDQGQEELAIQREKCAAMAILKGWTIDSEFVDEGLSGLLEERDRPGLAGLLDAVQGREVDVVMVSSLDRLATKINLALTTIVQISELGAAFVSCQEVLDTGSPSGLFVLEFVNNLLDLEHLSTRGRESVIEQRAERHARERLPLGYFHGSQGPEIDIIQARAVRRVFELSRDGYTLDEIAEWLGFEGIASSSGEEWTASGVKSVLDNEDKYEGGVSQDGKTRYPAIL